MDASAMTLYYRINVLSIDVPPLRRAPVTDIPVLIDFFLKKNTRATLRDLIKGLTPGNQARDARL